MDNCKPIKERRGRKKDGVPKRDVRSSSRDGFGVAPILYMLGLIGVGAGVLFSSYSQSIKNNINLTNSFGVKAILSPQRQPSRQQPRWGHLTTPFCVHHKVATHQLRIVIMLLLNCSISPRRGMSHFHHPIYICRRWPAALCRPMRRELRRQSKLAYLKPGAGVKQFDPWGHYYIVCRWENLNSPSTPELAFQIIFCWARRQIANALRLDGSCRRQSTYFDECQQCH